MADYSIEQVVEALVFASPEPVSGEKIAAAVEVSPDVVASAVESLNAAYEREKRAFRIMEISGGYQYRTLPEFADSIRGLGRQVASGRISLAALETLAIIAYRQPISRVEIEKVRGVNVSGVVKTLLEKKLVTVTGRADVLGRPLLYGTTPQFLRYFGLSGLDQLPRESELQVILQEHADRAERITPVSKDGDGDDAGGEQRVLM